MKHTTTWIATFNGADARFYRWDRANQKLLPLALGVAAGMHKPEFSDRQVRSFSSASTARGSGDPKTDVERSMEDAFVQTVVQALTERAHANEFQALIVAAPPRALGAFRDARSQTLERKIRAEIAHDYVRTSPADLLTRLTEFVVP